MVETTKKAWTKKKDSVSEVKSKAGVTASIGKGRFWRTHMQDLIL